MQNNLWAKEIHTGKWNCDNICHRHRRLPHKGLSKIFLWSAICQHGTSLFQWLIWVFKLIFSMDLNTFLLKKLISASQMILFLRISSYSFNFSVSAICLHVVNPEILRFSTSLCECHSWRGRKAFFELVFAVIPSGCLN